MPDFLKEEGCSTSRGLKEGTDLAVIRVYLSAKSIQIGSGREGEMCQKTRSRKRETIQSREGREDF